MEKFTKITSNAAPWPESNIDTDIIIPKQFLKTVKRTGLGIHAFHDRRYTDDGQDNPEFILNKPAYQEAQILIMGDNFGCGSSREHAVWAIMDMGIRAIIAPSFADIFRTNATKNGLLLIPLPEKAVSDLSDIATHSPQTQFVIELASQTIEVDGNTIGFEIDPFVKKCFLEGLDDIALTLKNENKISQYEAEIKDKKPWLFAS